MDESSAQPPPKPSHTFPFLLAGLALLLGGIFGGFFLVKSSPKACTLEAKLCPDGSAVGRTGPNCEFTPCPQITTTSPSAIPDPTANWQTYTRISGITFRYPNDWTEQSNFSLQPPDKLMSIWVEGRTVGLECLTKTGTKSQLVNGKNVNLEYYSGIKSENCDNKGHLVIFLPVLTESTSFTFTYNETNKITAEKLFDQIFSTFKFLNQDIGKECVFDSDCGVNICDCKAEPKQNLTPAKQACLRVCEGSVKCVNATCILDK